MSRNSTRPSAFALSTVLALSAFSACAPEDALQDSGDSEQWDEVEAPEGFDVEISHGEEIVLPDGSRACSKTIRGTWGTTPVIPGAPDYIVADNLKVAANVALGATIWNGIGGFYEELHTPGDSFSTSVTVDFGCNVGRKYKMDVAVMENGNPSYDATMYRPRGGGWDGGDSEIRFNNLAKCLVNGTNCT